MGQHSLSPNNSKVHMEVVVLENRQITAAVLLFNFQLVNYAILPQQLRDSLENYLLKLSIITNLVVLNAHLVNTRNSQFRYFNLYNEYYESHSHSFQDNKFYFTGEGLTLK